jgi:MFS family permease
LKLSGVGYGLVFAPTSTIISYYFDNHRALANGIMVSGSGVGALTHPFIYR